MSTLLSEKITLGNLIVVSDLYVDLPDINLLYNHNFVEKCLMLENIIQVNDVPHLY